MDSWIFKGETLYPQLDKSFNKVEVQAWLIFRNGLQRRRSAMFYIDVGLGRDKENSQRPEDAQKDVGCPEPLG